jgi:hypothetical protein
MLEEQMSLNEHGYLGEQIATVSQDIYNDHKEVFDVCFELNVFAQKTKYSFQAEWDDNQQLFAAALFVRVLNGFQAAIILYKHGLSIEARVVARTVFEAYFFLKKVCEEEDFSDRLIDDDDAKRLKLINSMLHDKNASSTIQQKRTELEQEKQTIVERGVSKANQIQVQQVAGEWYSIYRVLSDYVHVSAWMVSQCLGDAEGFIEWGPRDDDLELTLISLGEALKASLALMCNEFQADCDPELPQLEQRLTLLHEKLKSASTS